MSAIEIKSMSASDLIDLCKAEARNAGREAAGEEVAEKWERSFRAQDRVGDTESTRTAREKMTEFTREMRGGLRRSAGFVKNKRRFVDPNPAAAQLVALLAKSEFSPGGVERSLDELRKSDPGRWAGVEKILQATDFTAGGAMVQGSTSPDFVEALFAENVVLNMGARTIDISDGPVDMGKMNQTPVFYWVGENEPVTVSEPSTGKLILQEKEGAVLVPISERLLSKLPAGMESIIEGDMVRAANNGLDTAYISGTGSQAQPRGIYHGTSTAQIFDATAGGSPSLANVTTDLFTVWYQPQKENIPGEAYGWMMHPRSAVFLMQLRTTDGYHVYLDMLSAGNLYGDPVGLTTNISNVRGGSNDASRMFFGDFGQVVIGQGQDVLISRGQGVSFKDANGNTVHGFTQGVVLLKVSVFTDSILRHDESFGILDNVQWGNSFDA